MHSVRAESMKVLAMEQTAKSVEEIREQLKRVQEQLDILLKRESTASQKGRS